MESPLKGGRAWQAAALILAVPAFLFPLYNPDLFWHLSVARWIIENRSLPRADFLSFTAAGREWLDFEWLSQLVFCGAHSLGGMGGLWLVKIILLAASWLVLDKVLRLNQASGHARAGALGLWSAGVLAHSDIRPELFSVLFLSLTFHLLEIQRLGKRGPCKPALAGGLLFALWANLHAGFTFGLALIVLYGLVEAARRRWAAAGGAALLAAAGAAGTLLNPYGLGPHRVAWHHFQMRAELSLYIKEWHPMTLENPLHWPFWAVLAFCGLLLLYRLAPWGEFESLPWAPALAAVYFGAGALAHARLAAFFNVSAVLFLCALAAEAGWLGQERLIRRILLAGFALYAGYLAWLIPHVSWRGVFNYKHVPRQATEFMARERRVVERLRIFNQWEWGGYLAWRLHPWFKVFGDGRYIFHAQLPETAGAASESGRWREFMEKKGLTGALVPNLDMAFPTRRLYPDKTSKTFQRPWYLFYMPRERWALVYWDDQALFLVERRAVPGDWLSRHEYRYWLPKDRPAFQEALRLGEIPAERLAAERARQEQERNLTPLSPSP